MKIAFSSIVGGVNNAGNGIQVARDVKGVKIYGAHAVGNGRDGVHIAAGADVEVRDVRAVNNKRHGVHVGWESTLPEPARESLFAKRLLAGVAGRAIWWAITVAKP